MTTHTFVLSRSKQGHTQNLQEIPRAVVSDVARQRRSSRKSRNGCGTCKRRHIKCDGADPCSNCISRSLVCLKRNASHRCGTKSSAARALMQQPLSHISTQIDSKIDLLHLKLFHHFTSHTVPTLILPSKVWDDAIRLSFNFEFLANIMLCISARHLASLHPTEHLTYNSLAAKHLSMCLSGFRQALLGDLKAFEIDAFIATSLLLQYEMWTDADVCSRMSDGADIYDPSTDRMFTFCSSLKRMFLDFLPRWPGRLEDSVFLSHLRHAPNLVPDQEQTIPRLAQTSVVDGACVVPNQQPVGDSFGAADDHKEYPEQQHQTSAQHELQRHSRGNGVQYRDIANQVEIYESYLPDMSLKRTGSVNAQCVAFPDLLRSLFSFPVMCRGTFASLTQAEDPDALRVLLRFYRAIKSLLPQQQGWWMHTRAEAAEQGLLSSLQRTGLQRIDRLR